MHRRSHTDTLHTTVMSRNCDMLDTAKQINYR